MTAFRGKSIVFKYILTAIAAASLAAADAQAARLALVIGNDAYTHITPLKNAKADAKAIAKALEKSGFKVTLALDQGRSGMNSAVRRFKASVSGGDEAVFFYSGHGVQLGGANYLLPVDLSGDDEEHVKDDAVQLQRVLDDLAEQKASFSLAIIDACRDNPFKGKGRNMATRGLAPTSAASGQMIIFSAGAGQQALDRLGDTDKTSNGVFTRVLLREIEQGRQPIDRALKSVRAEVVRLAKSIGHDQVPALYDQSIGDFYFRRGGSAEPAPVVGGEAEPEAVAAVAPVPAAERSLWEAVKNANAIDDYEAYLSRHPDGSFAAEARSRIVALKNSALSIADKASWENAEKLASIDGYRSYVERHPNGAYVPLASLRLGRLEQDKAKKRAECPTCPSEGDAWEYQLVDGLTGPKGSLRYTLRTLTPAEVVESIDSDTLRPRAASQSFARAPGGSGRIVPYQVANSSDSWWIWEPNPYQMMAKLGDPNRAGAAIEMNVKGGQCTGKSGAVETVTVPAGKFNARRIDFSCSVDPADYNAGGWTSSMMNVYFSVWVEPTLYRPVKISKRVDHQRLREVDELQLVRFAPRN